MMNETPYEEIVRTGGYAVPVLKCDNHILCVVKPCNMPVQADASGDEDLLNALKGYIGKRFHKPGNVYLGLVHRLDRPVGGVMVFARTSKAAARLSAAFSSHTAQKRYLAVLQGEMRGEAELENWLIKDERTGMVRAADPAEKGAKDARLLTRPIAVGNGLTLTGVTLYTGRAHQIRVQHMLAGFPLWGDARYGNGRPGEQIALWAYRLTFPHPTLGQDVTLSSLPRGGVWDGFRTELECLS